MLHAIDYYIDHIKYEKNYSVNTVEEYQRDLMQLFDFFTGTSIPEDFNGYYKLKLQINNGEPDIHTITTNDLRNYLEFCYDRGLKKSSIERKIASMKSF